MRSITYNIPLNPISWKRAGLNGKCFFDKQTNDKLAVGLYLINQHGSEAKFTGPVKVEITFFMRQSQHVARRTKCPYVSAFPDIDNLQKFIFDCINNTATIWTDDKQVAWVDARKMYDKEPHTSLTIIELI